ncbi:von Willebrand factor type A domain-containing protein [Nostocoides sp. Soil756]|jgi:Ca-activated chloride channel family protein|uniref:vWA domain-containing protein n=1 Tax=Nostocoides sp. Soil756 TaxID=1736399 RepID=UPI0006F7F36B|nr:von Willebrand factor type A domain-containing protein [Tetrasphaera sp. Soil756]KRE63546.1 hypothetical protein ASG78_01170 [Tetrasphaera sp. Soil756]
MQLPSPHRSSAVPALTAAALAGLLALTGCSASSSGSTDGGQVAPGPNGAAPSDRHHPGPEPTSRNGLGDSENPMTDAAQDPLSTFALDIDTGSYTRFRDAVTHGEQLPRNQIRTEEFVNYFDQDYEAPRDGLGVSVDAAALPFSPGHRLVRIGIRSADVPDRDRPDADLVLVVDCSGSMGEADKMPTTKTALRTLVGSLRDSDRVAMVCYSSQARVVLDPTPVSERDTILDAVDALRPQSSTNAEAGLTTGYDLATEMRQDGRMTRVVLISDGVANVGATTAGGILRRIGDETRHGIHLVSVGVGIADYNDRLLEQLADRGDGWHVYVDDAREAERVFGTGLTGSLVVTARDAKAQVEFDPEQVAGYRLLGYENRALADDQFRDDGVDGGEVFAGHATTALYDVELRGRGSRTPFVTATVRYQDATGRPVERSGRLSDAECAGHPEAAAPRLRQDLVIALLTDRLTDGPWARAVDADTLRDEAAALSGLLDGDPAVGELADLVERTTA